MGINCLYSFKTKRKVPFQKTLLKALILLVIATVSSLFYQQDVTSHFQKATALCDENPPSLTGVVSGEVHRYNDTDYCTVTMENNEKVSVKIRTDKSLLPGEKVTLYEPTLSVISPNNRESGKVRQMLGNDTFLSATFPYEAQVTRHGVENWWLYGSKMLRNQAKDHFSQYYPTETASFLTALVSSDKSMMPEEQYQEFINTGTVHIVVVSGMHFGFFANALLFLLGIFCQGRRKRLFITLPLLLIFAWFTGGTLPVVRSFMMIAILFCYDIFYIKPIKSYVTVLAIACLFTGITPTLIFNPSFLLTFGATLGITAFYEPLLNRFHKIPTKYLRSTLAMYVAVQPFTLPVILLYFSRMPLGAVIANFLVAPLVAPILILAVVGMAVAEIGLLGPLVLWCTNLFAEFFLFLIHNSANISYPLHVPLKAVPFLLWLGGGLLVFFVCNLVKKSRKIGAGILAAIFMITALLHTIFPFPDNQLTITFFGAKNTNSAVIKTPADRLILYGSLQDIAYAKGSAYDENAPVALVILTDMSDSEKTELLLEELPSSLLICPQAYQHLLDDKQNTLFLTENLATQIDGIGLRLFGDSKNLYEAEFSYNQQCFSFSQDANYILRNSHINPEKIWIANFKRSSKTTQQLGKIPSGFRILSKKVWHSDTQLYDNYSMLIFYQNDITLYGTKEQMLLWN